MKPDKKELRAHIRSLKKAMLPEEIARRSQGLCGLVLDTEVYRQSKTIYGYLPFNQEVDLTALLRQAMADGKQIALPKCYRKEMRFILVEDLSRIQYSSFGAPEPAADTPIAADKTALMILPGLLFDRLGYRIGYGGGYYDRFLAQEPDHPTIGLCFDFQLVDRLDLDDHDIPAQTVFSL
jgi:5-formyltetrahydrofolate cyclo-ligase